MDLLLLALLLIVAAVVVGAMRTFSARRTEPETDSAADSEPNPTRRLDQLAEQLEAPIDRVAHPSELLENAAFQDAVSLMASDAFTLAQVGNYATGANFVLRTIGMEALHVRDTEAQMLDTALRSIRGLGAFPIFFMLRFAGAHTNEPFISRAIIKAEYWWRDHPVMIDSIAEAIEAQRRRQQPFVFGNEALTPDSDQHENVAAFIAALPPAQRDPVRAAYHKARKSLVDTAFLRSIGEMLGTDRLREPVYDTAQIVQLQAEFAEELAEERPRSILIVGPSGVGKTALRRQFARTLLNDGWRACRTSARELVADKKYIGEIEGQIRRLTRNASVGKKVAIFADSLSELNDYGKSSSNKNSVLDQMWPAIEARHVLLISETTTSGLQTLLRRFPSLPTTVKVMTLLPTNEEEAARLMTQHLNEVSEGLSAATCGEVVDESLKLAQQYLSHKSLPGSALSLMDLTVQLACRDGIKQPRRTHVLAALSQVSGLPEDILDDKQNLDIDALRAAFRTRVVGQDEAVNCLVERIAMLKAGLSDPGRPIGVFLFAGPTGTGKTEIAKTLAHVLFGSEDQMTRLDMSEYQSADSSWRLLGGSDEREAGRSLVSRIRERPFSVVLLDEFEKAHPKIWDLFLQVFDDGRLSDTRGYTADFRHAIIILTSNLGARIDNQAGPGFTSRSGQFSPGEVLRTVERNFRPEFINRLDRVVVFQPLSREVMRGILRKELNKVLERRGLRNRQWAVEWEDSAVEFLLSEGFTPDLGARPLRRAIEQHLLAPLSLTMVQNRAPDGEQFLFVRSSGDGLDVEFVDPDAVPGDTQAIEEATVGGEDPSLKKILLRPLGRIEDAPFVLDAYAAITARVHSPEWVRDKADLMQQMNDSGFWERPERMAVLERIELVDRIDAATATLGRHAERLGARRDNRTLIHSMAGRLYVLAEGLRDFDERRPTSARIGVRLVTEDKGIDGADQFLRNMAQMYRAWARARGMRIEPVSSNTGRYNFVHDVSGFGCFGLLDTEAGVHVFEVPIDSSRYQRIRARVNVVEPGRSIDDTSQRETGIVRRYRRDPSPLVRDSVHGWRTGKIDLVFGGAFDLFGADGQ